jgi:hypothetical protein
MVVRCHLCGRDLTTTHMGVYRFVEGWEKVRSQGGTNAISMRKVHDQWAHGTCVELKSRGLLDQEVLDV